MGDVPVIWQPPQQVYRVTGDNQLQVGRLAGVEARGDRRGQTLTYAWPDGQQQSFRPCSWPKDVAKSPRQAVERRVYVCECGIRRIEEVARQSLKRAEEAAQKSLARAAKLRAALANVQGILASWGPSLEMDGDEP